MKLRSTYNAFEVSDGKYENTCFELTESVFDGNDLVTTVFFHIMWIDGKPTDFSEDELDDFKKELGIIINKALTNLVENNG